MVHSAIAKNSQNYIINEICVGHTKVRRWQAQIETTRGKRKLISAQMSESMLFGSAGCCGKSQQESSNWTLESASIREIREELSS